MDMTMPEDYDAWKLESPYENEETCEHDCYNCVEAKTCVFANTDEGVSA